MHSLFIESEYYKKKKNNNNNNQVLRQTYAEPHYINFQFLFNEESLNQQRLPSF